MVFALFSFVKFYPV